LFLFFRSVITENLYDIQIGKRMNWKNLISIILLSVYGAELLAPIIPFADYFLHKKYIEENLCINRDKPEMHCHGTCHLKKELNLLYKETQPEKNPEQEKGIISKITKEYTFYNIFYFQNNIPCNKIALQNFPPIFCIKSDGFIREIFRPPAIGL